MGNEISMACAGITNQFNRKDLLWASITKSNVKQNAGLNLFQDNGGIIRVQKVDGAFEMFTEVKPGYRLLQFQEKDVSSYEGGIQQIENLIKTSLKVQVKVLKPSGEADVRDDENTSAVTFEIAVGDILVLQDMALEPELNDKAVKVLRESIKSGRWLVEIQETKKKTIVDCSNLVMMKK